VFNGGSVFTYGNCNFYYLTDTKKYAKTLDSNIHGKTFTEYNTECERYSTISDWACSVVSGASQVALEGYSYSSTGRVFHIAENTGVLKYKLWERSIPVEIIPPTTIKKFASGKGNANKEKMYESFIGETGIHIKEKMGATSIVSPINDIVDSFYICKYFHNQLYPDTTS
jgi:Holliday junction resolvasome RuvABC endonuclease subunit